ncbi:MAG: hypothetical protein LUD47_03230 [Clostridia bacterium]|nr:hypothetical protein [Clostridia bacterium]
MKWESLSIGHKTEILRIATEFVAMSVCENKTPLVRNMMLRHRYQALDILSCEESHCRTDEYVNFVSWLVTYFLTLSEAFKGDMYYYFCSYTERAYDYLHKTPSDARMRTESDELNSVDIPVGKEKDGSDGEFDP